MELINRQGCLDSIIKRLCIKNESYLLESERAIYQQILAEPAVEAYTRDEVTTILKEIKQKIEKRGSLSGDFCYVGGMDEAGKYIQEKINELENNTEDPALVIHARWLSGDCKGAHCSYCEEYTPFIYGSYNYCPNCGAKME